MKLSSRTFAVIALVMGLMIMRADAELVTGRVVSIGFPATTPNGAVIRLGRWFPIRVQLAIQGTGTVTRTIKFESIDLDGDRVAIIRPEVTVTTEGGAGFREIWCYGLVNALGEEFPQALVLLDENGAAAERLPLPTVDWLPNDDLLVVDVSDMAVVGLMRLMTPAWSPGSRMEGTRDFYRNVVVSKLAAADLPDRWIGLECADIVVWDQPNASDLKRIGPMDALLQWVDHGGQLIVGVGGAWPALRGSTLGARLPLAGDGVVAELNDLPLFRQRFLTGNAAASPLERVTLTTVADLAPDAIRTLGELGGPRGSINMVAMRSSGAGRIVASAASLRDLTPSPAREQAFFAGLMELNTFSEAEKTQQAAAGQQYLGANYVYDDVVAAIGFGTATALRSMLAFFFVAIYAFVATAGTWLWLNWKKRTTLSWTAFTIVAGLASVLSLSTVGLTRGCSSGVQSFQILDFAAGETTARGHTLFGYRSPTRSRDSLTVTSTAGFLRPLTRSPVRGQYFVTPDRYVADPGAGKLNDVLVRATLKQLEGYWAGDLGGTIQARIIIDRATGRISPDSFIANELDVPISGGLLLYTDPRHDDGGVPRPAGLTRLYDLPDDDELQFVPPSRNILVASFAGIGAKAKISELAADAYRKLDADLNNWRRSASPKRADKPDLRTLLAEHQAWQSAFGASAARAVVGAMLASTRNYYNHRRSAVVADAWIPLSIESLPELDITHWLISGRDSSGDLAGYGILLAWTDQPGPAALNINGSTRAAYAGQTLFRVRVPLRYLGSPPPRGGDAP